MFSIPVMIVTAVISYTVTGKGVSDNVVSIVAQRDCALHYIVTDETICKPKITVLSNGTAAPIAPVTREALTPLSSAKVVTVTLPSNCKYMDLAKTHKFCY